MPRLMIAVLAVASCLIAVPAFGQEEAAQELSPETVRLFDACKDKLTTPAQVEELIKAGAEIDARGGDGRTPLMCAAGFDMNSEVINLLINAGAEVNARDLIGYTPLIIAASKTQNPEVITAIIKGGAEVNARDIFDLTPLMHAADSNRNPEV
ncbi:ankyrin repeat domain-containing protein, partial [Myxococcota bacterium]|nr:ankyrin repeat domain-containing protein [Myxococcota bacterium]